MRPDAQLAEKQWEMLGSDGAIAVPEPTNEEKPLQATSVYALSKRDQEDYCLLIGGVYGIPTVALRYFNIYGPRQALSNPYTGVAAIFGSCLLNGDAPIIYEDGCQSRDFVHVSDIVQANMLALEADATSIAGQVFNVGTGRPTNLIELLELLEKSLDTSGVDPIVPDNSGPAIFATATPTSRGSPRRSATNPQSPSMQGSRSLPRGCVRSQLRTSHAALQPSSSAKGSCDDTAPLVSAHRGGLRRVRKQPVGTRRCERHAALSGPTRLGLGAACVGAWRGPA
jgi:hypothetical protein